MRRGALLLIALALAATVATARPAAAADDAAAELARVDAADREVDRLIEEGELDRALALALETLHSRSRLLGPDHHQAAWSLARIARVLHRRGDDLATALALRTRANEIIERAVGPDATELAVGLEATAPLLLDMGRADDAGAAFARALAIYERAEGEISAAAAACHYGLGAIALAGGRRDEALARQLRARAILEHLFGPDHIELADVLNEIALIRRADGALDDAVVLVTRIVEIEKIAHGEHAPQVGLTQSNLALLHEERGDLPAALRTYREALGRVGALGESDRDVVRIRARAQALERAAEGHAAQLEARLGALLAEHGPRHPASGEAAAALARHLRSIGEPVPDAMARTFAAFERALGPDHPALLAQLQHIVPAMREHGRAEAALRHARQAVRIVEKDAGETQPIALAYWLDQLGQVLLDSGDDEAARPIFEREVAVCERHLGADHPVTANALMALAGYESRVGDSGAAAERLRRVLAIRRASSGDDHPSTLTVRLALGSVLMDLGDLREARGLLEEALRSAERDLAPDDPRLADVLAPVGRLWRELGDYRRAREVWERALAIAEEAVGEQSPELMVPLSNLASVLVRLGELERARALHARGLALAERRFGRDDFRTVVQLGALAGIHRDLGELEEAEELARRALDIVERTRPEDRRALARMIDNLVVVLAARGRYAEALRLGERAVVLTRAHYGGDHRYTLLAMQNQAGVLSASGDLTRARHLLERVVAVAEESLGAEHPRVGLYLGNLAAHLLSIGKTEAARPMLERALAIRATHLGPAHPAVALELERLGGLILRQGDPWGARPLLEAALTIHRAALGPAHPRVPGAMFELGLLHLGRGDAGLAASMLTEATGMLRSGLGPSHPRLAAGLRVLGLARLRAGDEAGARACWEESLAILEAAFGAQHPDVVACLDDLASLALARGEPDRARELLERALAVGEHNVRRYLAGTTPAERIALAAGARRTLHRWLLVPAPAGETGYEAVLRIRGVVFRAGEAERRAQRRAGGQTATAMAELRAAQSELARLAHAARPTDAAEAARYARAAARCEQLSLALAERSAAYRTASARLDIDLAAVTARLGPHAALVDYLRYEDRTLDGTVTARYVAWVLTGDGGVRRIELGDAAPIEAAAARFVAAVRAAEGDERAAGRALRALVWDPVARHLPESARTVHLAPDAALASVPFAALPGDEPDRYLLDEVAIVHHATAQDIVPWPDEGPRGAGALLLGAVSFDPVDAPGTGGPAPAAGAPRDGPRFDPLPGTAAELDAVSARLRAAGVEPSVLRAAKATEAALRAGAPGRRFVHLATHGFVRPDLPPALAEPLASHLVRYTASRDPLLLSGLALAGANARAGGGDDDGILTALEAGTLELDGVELVCLSACDTAGGVVRAGEGVLGLVRAFREAGAQNVVASLWPVQDDAARRLMVGLYDHLLEAGARSPAEALREAALALRALEVEVVDRAASLEQGREVRVRRRAFAEPRHWAAFVAYGSAGGE